MWPTIGDLIAKPAVPAAIAPTGPPVNPPRIAEPKPIPVSTPL